jgi:hypothetical protein
VSGRDLARRHQPPLPQHQANVSGEVTMTRDELAIQLRPTSVTDGAAPEREPRIVITRPVPQPLVISPTVHQHPPRWVFDQQAITALIAFVLVAAFFVMVWRVIP